VSGVGGSTLLDMGLAPCAPGKEADTWIQGPSSEVGKGHSSTDEVA
jgi:hypothetical protein